MEKTKTDCEGCKSRNYIYKHLTTIKKGMIKHVVCGPLPGDEICPCSLCIVKMICTKQCKEYALYRGYIKGKVDYRMNNEKT